MYFGNQNFSNFRKIRWFIYYILYYSTCSRTYSETIHTKKEKDYKSFRSDFAAKWIIRPKNYRVILDFGVTVVELRTVTLNILYRI